MPPPPHSRPENVLKRAQELIGVEQQQAALSLLHEHVTSKRTRNSPISSLEPVMMLFVELCVDLRRGKLAKDGLYQYKNTAQNTNVGTIELVFKHFIELAERKVTEAQAKADEVQAGIESTSAAANVEDLEASETPESILLSTVSGEQSRDRTDRAIVTPWLKFLWETYRIVLDVFKNNAKLEIMYQTTAHQAFQFCSKYQRKTEFRRLCELLRNHLQNAAKFSSQMHAINLSDPDTLQRHLDTRFNQLNVAVELELWQEAFRSVEDIHTLLSLSKRPAKNVMMANYFEKLTRIFLVSENYLFHAASWSRYYNLLRQSAAAVATGQSLKKDNPAVTEADMTKAASFVLLSALSIPVISTARSRGALVDVDEAKKNKNVRLTNLLGMSQAPTRAILFKDALNKGLLKRCRPEIRDLYNMLEVDFHPLFICKKISPILTQIGEDPEMKQYVAPLQQVILTRLFQQLSQVYDSVKLEFVMSLAQFPESFQVTKSGIEKFIMNGCKKGDLAIRIDHASGVLTFDSDVFSSARALHPGSAAGSAETETSSVQRLQSTPAEIVRTTLTRLAKSLYVSCQYVDPSFNEKRRKQKEIALERAKAGAEQEHLDTLARREVIERKKQAAASASAQKERDLAVEKRARAQQQQAAEAKRLADEQRARDLKRIEAEKARIQEEEAQKALEELKRGTKGINLDEIDVANLDSGAIRAIKIQALEKEKNKLSDSLRTTGRRIDHLERAYRLEELKRLKDDYNEQIEKDRKAHEVANKLKLSEAKQKHAEDLALKKRLQRLVEPCKDFMSMIEMQRKSDFEKKRKAAERELEAKINQRKREAKEQRQREKKQREEEERRMQEEEDARLREEEEKRQAEETRRQQMAERKARAEEERKKADEASARQREREEEAERKIQEKRMGRTAPSGFAGRAEAPPGTWRDRESSRRGDAPAREPAAAAPADAEAEAPRRPGGGYVPPARRGDGERPTWRDGGARDGPPPSGARGSGKYVPGSFSRSRGPERDGSPAGGADGAGMPMERTGSGAGSAGKYRPGAFGGRQQGGGAK